MESSLTKTEELKSIVFQLTPKQIEFLSAFVYTNDIDKACVQVGVSQRDIVSWGDSQSLILRAAQLAQASRLDAVMGAMEYHAIRAVAVMAELMEYNLDPQIRFNAAKVFIEHILGKPKTKVETTSDSRELKMYMNFDSNKVLGTWEDARSNVIEGK